MMCLRSGRRVEVEVLGAVARTAEDYPALFVPMGLLSIGLALWAYRRRRWSMMAGAVLAAVASVLLCGGGAPADALSRLAAPAQAAILGGPHAGGGGPPRLNSRLSTDLANFSSSSRLHPRFPDDLPLPTVFKVEHSSGGLRTGSITVRFRFRGEGGDAVRQLKEMGEKSGWRVEVLAPHRLALRKGSREVDAWFSYPAHSVVLDVNDPR